MCLYNKKLKKKKKEEDRTKNRKDDSFKKKKGCSCAYQKLNDGTSKVDNISGAKSVRDESAEECEKESRCHEVIDSDS